MRRRSEIIGNALKSHSVLGLHMLSQSFYLLRVKRIVVVAILLSPGIAIPAMTADTPLPGPAPIPPNSYYPVAARLSWGLLFRGQRRLRLRQQSLDQRRGFDRQLRHDRGSRWGDSRFQLRRIWRLLVRRGGRC